MFVFIVQIFILEKIHAPTPATYHFISYIDDRMTEKMKRIALLKVQASKVYDEGHGDQLAVCA